MDMRELRDEDHYDYFLNTVSAISHLILCEKCRNSQTGHNLFVQRLAMGEDQFACGLPDEIPIPNHLKDCKAEDCERCAECRRHCDADLIVDEIADQLIRFIQIHTGLMSNIATPKPEPDQVPIEMEANFKSDEMEIVQLQRFELAPLSVEERNAIERYDSLRSAIFSVLHSVYCIGCYKHIDQVSEMRNSGQFHCKQMIGLPNHLALCSIPLCHRCERAALVSDKTLTANHICDRFIRFVEICAGVPPEKRMKAPPGRPFIPKAAASFKVVQKVEPEAESPVEAAVAETPAGSAVEAPANEKSDSVANLGAEPKANVAKLGSDAATKTPAGNAIEIPANQMANIGVEPKATQWLSKSILFVILIISLFINFLSIKCKVVDSTGH